MINDFKFELYLIRHGESEINVQPDKIGQEPDVKLTEIGKKQAQLLGERFKKQNINFDFVFSSPYKRAYDTAKIALGEGASIIESPELREYNAGDWTGKSRSETITKDVKLKISYLNHDFLFPNGESLSMVERRASEWLEKNILYNSEMQRVAQEKKESCLTIAAFSHGMLIKTFLYHLMGFDKSMTYKISIKNTSVCHLKFSSNGWNILSINDCCHLFG